MIMMPGLDGSEVCKRLKGNPELSEIPFIFITTMGMPKDVLTGFKSGERSTTSPNLSTFKRCVRVTRLLTLFDAIKKLVQDSKTDFLTGLLNR